MKINKFILKILQNILVLQGQVISPSITQFESMEKEARILNKKFKWWTFIGKGLNPKHFYFPLFIGM